MTVGRSRVGHPSAVMGSVSLPHRAAQRLAFEVEVDGMGGDGRKIRLQHSSAKMKSGPSVKMNTHAAHTCRGSEESRSKTEGAFNVVHTHLLKVYIHTHTHTVGF